MVEAGEAVGAVLVVMGVEVVDVVLGAAEAELMRAPRIMSWVRKHQHFARTSSFYLS
jgi:hypothetical protein